MPWTTSGCTAWASVWNATTTPVDNANACRAEDGPLTIRCTMTPLGKATAPPTADIKAIFQAFKQQVIKAHGLVQTTLIEAFVHCKTALEQVPQQVAR